MYVGIYIYICIYTYIFRCRTLKPISIFTYTCKYICIWIYTCMYICIFIYTCKYNTGDVHSGAVYPNHIAAALWKLHIYIYIRVNITEEVLYIRVNITEEVCYGENDSHHRNHLGAALWNLYIYIYIYIHMCINISMYIYIYIHKYACRYKRGGVHRGATYWNHIGAAHSNLYIYVYMYKYNRGGVHRGAAHWNHPESCHHRGGPRTHTSFTSVTSILYSATATHVDITCNTRRICIHPKSRDYEEMCTHVCHSDLLDVFCILQHTRHELQHTQTLKMKASRKLLTFARLNHCMRILVDPVTDCIDVYRNVYMIHLFMTHCHVWHDSPSHASFAASIETAPHTWTEVIHTLTRMK